MMFGMFKMYDLNALCQGVVIVGIYIVLCVISFPLPERKTYDIVTASTCDVFIWLDGQE